jgi:choice-of-anchor A domain-containing protein
MFLKRSMLAAVAALYSISTAHAGTALSLGTASGYNVFILGAYGTTGSTDIQGSVAVEGNFTSTGSLSINQSPDSSITPTYAGLVVGDSTHTSSLSLAGGQLDNTNLGNAWVGGNVSSSSAFNFEQALDYVGTLTPANITAGSEAHVNASTAPFVFSTAASSLSSLSSTLNSDTTNGTTAGSNGTYTLTATGCTLCIFKLTTGTINSLTINAPTGATVVVNVIGGSESFSNGTIAYSGGATASDTIFNFNTATTITTGGITVEGSILAPLATFTGGNGGTVNGELIAAAVSNNAAEFESANIFQGNLGSVTTPEPSSWILVAGALIGFAAFGWKRRTPAVSPVPVTSDPRSRQR